MTQGVQDREFHIRQSELGDDRAVLELDERVNDGLRVDDDPDLVVGNIEQPVRLDHFETLVHQGR